MYVVSRLDNVQCIIHLTLTTETCLLLSVSQHQRSPGMAQSSPLLSLDTLHRARATVASSSLGVRHTPCLQVLYFTTVYSTLPAFRCCTVMYCTVLYTPASR